MSDKLPLERLCNLSNSTRMLSICKDGEPTDSLDQPDMRHWHDQTLLHHHGTHWLQQLPVIKAKHCIIHTFNMWKYSNIVVKCRRWMLEEARNRRKERENLKTNEKNDYGIEFADRPSVMFLCKCRWR